MTEITDLDPVDSGNTAISGESLDGAIANMGRMDNTLQAFAGMLGRSIRSTYLRWIDGTDSTKRVALDLSGLPTATTRTWTAPYYSGTLGLVSDIRGHIYGLTLSNNVTDATNDIDIAAGSAVDTTGVVSMLLASSLTKRLDAAWAVGTNQGMLASGAAITNTTYHIFLIRRPDTGVVDIAADTSATGSNIAANTNAAYTQIRRIGSIIRSAGTILRFYQNGDHFVTDDTTVEYNATTARAMAALTLTGVPAGISVRPILTARNLMVTAGDALTYVAPTLTSVVQLVARTQAGADSDVNTFDFISTTTNREIFFQVSILSGTVGVVLNSKGWIDSRGKNG